MSKIGLNLSFSIKSAFLSGRFRSELPTRRPPAPVQPLGLADTSILAVQGRNKKYRGSVWDFGISIFLAGGPWKRYLLFGGLGGGSGPLCTNTKNIEYENGY